jgi:hypothetical protein
MLPIGKNRRDRSIVEASAYSTCPRQRYSLRVLKWMEGKLTKREKSTIHECQRSGLYCHGHRAARAGGAGHLSTILHSRGRSRPVTETLTRVVWRLVRGVAFGRSRPAATGCSTTSARCSCR